MKIKKEFRYDNYPIVFPELEPMDTYAQLERLNREGKNNVIWQKNWYVFKTDPIHFYRRINDYEMMLDALRNGYENNVIHAINNGLNLNKIRNGESISILFYCMLNHSPNYKNNIIIKLLLENGADPNFIDSRGKSILSIATRYQCIDVMYLLISCGAKINVTKNGEYSALYSALSIYEYDKVELLLEHGADPDYLYGDDSNPLLYAIEFGNLRMIKMLIKYGASVNYTKSINDSCKEYNILIFAYRYNSLEIFKYLLEYFLIKDIEEFLNLIEDDSILYSMDYKNMYVRNDIKEYARLTLESRKTNNVDIDLRYIENRYLGTTVTSGMRIDKK